jgi:hypothetical protein
MTALCDNSSGAGCRACYCDRTNSADLTFVAAPNNRMIRLQSHRRPPGAILLVGIVDSPAAPAPLGLRNWSLQMRLVVNPANAGHSGGLVRPGR